MIIKLKEWCEGIIIAIIVSIIIEMLIPDNKNKKYIKVVIGIYIMVASLNPILELLNYDIDFENIFDIEAVETNSQDYSDDFKDVYILGIEETIKEDIDELGYEVEDVKVIVDSNYENIEGIELKIKGKKKNVNIIDVQEIVIGDGKNENIIEYPDIIAFLEKQYLVQAEQIIFK